MIYYKIQYSVNSMQYQNQQERQNNNKEIKKIWFKKKDQQITTP
jgi:hypothetical protein